MVKEESKRRRIGLMLKGGMAGDFFLERQLHINEKEDKADQRATWCRSATRTCQDVAWMQHRVQSADVYINAGHKPGRE